jgi:hypothetical protein
MTYRSSNMYGGYTYDSGLTRTYHGGKSLRNRNRNKSRKSSRSRSRSRSIGLSLARGRTYSGGFAGFPNGYSTGGHLNPLISALANPTPIHPYNTCEKFNM